MTLVERQELSEIARLRDRVEELERLVGTREPPVLFVRLTPREEQLFGLLMSRERLTRAFAFEAVWGGDSEVSDKILDVMISKLRTKLRQFDIGIKNLWSVGYSITPEDKAKVRAMNKVKGGNE